MRISKQEILKRCKNNKHAAVCRERYWNYREHYICPNCGQQDAEPGMAYCKTCMVKNRQRKLKSDPDRSKAREYSRNLRAERKAKGLCIDCGKPTRNDKVRCAKCLDDKRFATAIWRLKKKMAKEVEEARRRSAK